MNNTVRIVFVHNHPSRDPKPSKEDIKTMKNLNRAGKIMGIPVLDHVIIGHKGFYSVIGSKLEGKIKRLIKA